MIAIIITLLLMNVETEHQTLINRAASLGKKLNKEHHFVDKIH